ncbi:MAG: hypothetical protein A3A86_05505 [Elusimicrobia bacterium RIFCSPLOWO2_01_FULL_60_11]|nr:MAG: hypothetical protein A3A86_05505 [Elusimicrobia bacterium RIFCSPLOWO2_01_FULL_60_11]
MKKLKPIPRFKSENEEFEFWSKRDSTEYFDLSKAKRVRFPNLRRTTKLVALNMPISLIDKLKYLANKKDVAYQSLMKLFLDDRVSQELRKAS